MLSSIPGLYPLNDFKDTCPHPPDVPTKIAFSSGPMSPGEKADPVENCCHRVLLRLFKVPNPYTEEAHPNVSCSRVYRWAQPRHTWHNQGPFQGPFGSRISHPIQLEKKVPSCQSQGIHHVLFCVTLSTAISTQLLPDTCISTNY